MSSVYVVEYASEEWGGHPAWYENEFDNLQDAEQEALAHLGWGDAVRMYVKESKNDSK